MNKIIVSGIFLASFRRHQTDEISMSKLSKRMFSILAFLSKMWALKQWCVTKVAPCISTSHNFLTSQICLLKLFAKVNSCQKIMNLQVKCHEFTHLGNGHHCMSLTLSHYLCNWHHHTRLQDCHTLLNAPLYLQELHKKLNNFPTPPNSPRIRQLL